MIRIDGINFNEELLNSKFSCDLSKCKGACCTFPGEYGAPLLDEEIQLIEQIKTKALKYLSQRSINIINEFGFYDGKSNSYTTKCIDKKDCVFVYYEGNIAKCSIEAAYINDETGWRKPVSCHLFPVRVRTFPQLSLHYEKIPECKPGVDNGKLADIDLITTVKAALIRAFGEEWVNELEKLRNDS